MRPLRPHGAKTARGTNIPIRTMTSLPKIFKGLRGWLGRVHETNRVQVCNTSHHEIFENQKSFLEISHDEKFTYILEPYSARPQKEEGVRSLLRKLNINKTISMSNKSFIEPTTP